MAKNLLKGYFEMQVKKAKLAKPLRKPIKQKPKEISEEPIKEITNLSAVLVLLYESLYQQISLKSHYRFFPTYSDKIQICRFIKWVRVNKRTHANIDFLIAYFEFQFSHYEGVKTKYGKNQIMFNWIIGTKAILRFEQRKVSERWLVRLKNKNVGLNLKKVLEKFDKPEKLYVNKLYEFEEKEKNRYYNTPKGIMYCLTVTTLFNPISTVCLNCINKKDCKVILKENFPKLFTLRNID